MGADWTIKSLFATGTAVAAILSRQAEGCLDRKLEISSAPCICIVEARTTSRRHKPQAETSNRIGNRLLYSPHIGFLSGASARPAWARKTESPMSRLTIPLIAAAIAASFGSACFAQTAQPNGPSAVTPSTTPDPAEAQSTAPRRAPAESGTQSAPSTATTIPLAADNRDVQRAQRKAARQAERDEVKKQRQQEREQQRSARKAQRQNCREQGRAQRLRGTQLRDFIRSCAGG